MRGQEHSVAARHKRCPQCGETKPRESFGVRGTGRAAGRGWLRSACLTCENASWKRYRDKNPTKIRAHQFKADLRIKCGLSVEEYEAMLQAQRGTCAICRRSPSPKKRLAVDHNHATGVRRGLLCDPCNQGIGHFRDEPQRLRAAADYLDRQQIRKSA